MTGGALSRLSMMAACAHRVQGSFGIGVDRRSELESRWALRVSNMMSATASVISTQLMTVGYADYAETVLAQV